MIEDIYHQTCMNINSAGIKNIEDLQNNQGFVVSFSSEMESNSKKIKSFLFDNVYNHKNLVLKRDNVEKIISKLSNIFILLQINFLLIGEK